MAYRPGIRNIADVNADIAVTNSAVLVTTGLTAPIAAGQRMHIKAWVPITVGATGGVRFQVLVPAGGTVFELTAVLNNTVAPSSTLFEQQASAVMTNALANAGDHWIEIEATIINGATAGNVDVQAAQNTADALTLTISRGGTMDVTIY